MKFRLRDAPEWFANHVINSYIDELHRIIEARKHNPKFNNLEFRQISCSFFKEKGFNVWLDDEGHLWFDIEQDSPKWTFEILRG